MYLKKESNEIGCVTIFQFEDSNIEFPFFIRTHVLLFGNKLICVRCEGMIFKWLFNDTIIK